MAQRLVTDRLILRCWRVEDAQAALDVYGNVDVARWLSPVMDRVPDLAAMRLLLQQWIVEDARMPSPAGRWAIQRQQDERVIGGAILLPLPPGNEDLELGWQAKSGGLGPWLCQRDDTRHRELGVQSGHQRDFRGRETW